MSLRLFMLFFQSGLSKALEPNSIKCLFKPVEYNASTTIVDITLK